MCLFIHYSLLEELLVPKVCTSVQGNIYLCLFYYSLIEEQYSKLFDVFRVATFWLKVSSASRFVGDLGGWRKKIKDRNP